MGRIGVYPVTEEEKKMVERVYDKPVVRIRLEKMIGEVINHPRLGQAKAATTSQVIGVQGKSIVETLNTIYILEEI